MEKCLSSNFKYRTLEETPVGTHLLLHFHKHTRPSFSKQPRPTTFTVAICGTGSLDLPPRQAHCVKKEFCYLYPFLLILFLLVFQAFDRKCQATFKWTCSDFFNCNAPGEAISNSILCK